MSEIPGPTGIDWADANQTHGQVRFGNEKLNMAFFYTHACHNAVLSEQAGVPIYENKVYVRIQPPGERLNIVVRPVQDVDKKKWPREWAEFLAGKAQVPDGTPVEMLFPNHPAIGEMLKGNNIFTIQQLANASAHALDNIGMGAQGWQTKAQAYLASSDQGKEFHILNKNLEESNQKVRVLTEQLNQAIGQIRALEQRFNNPQQFNNLNPQNIQGVDIQAERINGNHKTKDLVKQKPKDPLSIDMGDGNF